jgi:hypothetical protein
MFAGQVFGSNLPLNLLAVAYAMLLRHCPPLTAGERVYRLMACVRVPSLEQESNGGWRPLTRRDSQRHQVGALVWTKFAHNTRSNETEKPHRLAAGAR